MGRNGMKPTDKKIKKTPIGIGNALRVGFEVHHGNSGTVLIDLVGKSVHGGRSEDKVLAENKLRAMASARSG